MLRNAALASSVVASMPMVLPLIKPAVLKDCSTQVKTARCVSRSINRRVREIVEWSGGRAFQTDGQEVAQRERVRSAPRNAALRIDALEVADQQQEEIDPRRQTWPTHRLGIEHGTLGFDEAVEPVLAAAGDSVAYRTGDSRSSANPPSPPTCSVVGLVS